MSRRTGTKTVQIPLQDPKIWAALRDRAALKQKSIALFCLELFSPILLRELDIDPAGVVIYEPPKPGTNFRRGLASRSALYRHSKLDEATV